MNSRVAIPGDGTTRLFSVPFPYINRQHVHLYINRIELLIPTQYKWTPDGKIELKDPVAVGSTLEIVRETPLDEPLVQFQNGAQLTEAELNLAVLQNLYITQELHDLHNALINGTLQRILDEGTDGSAGSIIDRAVEEVLNSELLADLQQRVADIDANAESIAVNSNNVHLADVELISVKQDAATLTQRVDLVETESANSVTRIDTLTADYNGLSATLQTEQQTRADADEALSLRIDTLQAYTNRIFIQATAPLDDPAGTLSQGDIWYDSSNGNHPYRWDGTAWVSVQDQEILNLQAQVQTEQQARIDADSAMASDISTLQAQRNSDYALIQTNNQARIDGDAANASSISGLEVRMGGAEAAIVTEQTARADGDNALTLRVDGLVADVNDNTSLILNEQTARANGDSALASDITTLQTRVGDNEASIQTIQTTQNGLTAEYMVKTDVNGYVTGFGLYNAGPGQISDFIVLADRFSIVTPGQTPVVPFVADANGVYMDTAYIRTLVVDKIEGGAIQHQWEINNANGRIVIDTGTHMKVIGAGFGAQGNLVEWFGPKMAVSQCSTSNSVSHETVDGSAYFGGTLSAGVLKNAATSTQLSQTASVSTGNFGSNGGARVVVASFIFSHGGSLSGDQRGTFPRALGVRINLRRGTTLLTTLDVVGEYTAQWYDAETDQTHITANFSGSKTYTDNTGGASAEYNAYLSNATGQWPMTLSWPNGPGQELSVVSTEE